MAKPISDPRLTGARHQGEPPPFPPDPAPAPPHREWWAHRAAARAGRLLAVPLVLGVMGLALLMAVAMGLGLLAVVKWLWLYLVG